MSLRLVHVQLPDGTVSEPMPMGQVLEMLHAGEITQDAQICERGSDRWNLLRYEPAVMRPNFHLATPAAAPQPASSAATMAPGEDLSAKLQRAALIFLALGVLSALLAGVAFGKAGFITGLSAPWTLAMIVGVFAHVLKGRQD